MAWQKASCRDVRAGLVEVTGWSLTDLRRFDRALNRSQVFLLAKPLM
jgi:hypothetical protein